MPPNTQTTTADVTITNPDVKRLNDAIVALLVRTVPPSRAVTMLYDRWVRFTQSPYFAALPDTSLLPIYKAFAGAYWAIARSQGAEPKDVDPRVIVLVAGDLNQSVEAAGKALDQTIQAAEKGGAAVASTLWKPLALVAAAALAIGWMRKRR
jgi:hypothetical protein